MKLKYSLFANTKYALQGFLALLRFEKSFKIELFIIIPALILNYFLPLTLMGHLFLAGVLILILITETLNSAIEACVDLITNKWHEKAKMVKDCGGAAVFFAIIFALFSWGAILFKVFYV